jgi:hypothetical protein
MTRPRGEPGCWLAVLDLAPRARRLPAGRGFSPEEGRDVRMAAPGLVAWAASARWSDTPWIARRRRVRRAQPGCIYLNRAALAGAWPGSASTSAACPRRRPLAFATFMASRVRSRIRSDSNSATIANTLNSSRPTGSVGSWIEPPRLSLTFLFVSSSRMSRASGRTVPSRVKLGDYQGVTGSAGGQR